MPACDERELRGVEIDVMDLIERHARDVDRARDDGDDAYAAAMSFANFKARWCERRFSNVHLGKPAQQTYNGYVQCAYDCAMKYARTGKTLATRATGVYCVYALHETQLEGEPVRAYACQRALEALAETIEACDAIGAHAVGRIVKKMMYAESFVVGARDTTNAPMSRMGAGAPEVFKNFDEKEAIHEALAHLLQERLDDELDEMSASASEYTRSLAGATRLEESTLAAPVTICSTVQTLLTKTKTKVERALKPPIEAGEPLMLPGIPVNLPKAKKKKTQSKTQAAPKRAEKLASMPSFAPSFD